MIFSLPINIPIGVIEYVDGHVFPALFLGHRYEYMSYFVSEYGIKPPYRRYRDRNRPEFQYDF